MNKKLISTAILTLGLLQGAGVAYAGQVHGQIGGDGVANIFSLISGAESSAEPTVGEQVGSLNIKLNVFAHEGLAKGDAFLVAAIEKFSPIMDNYDVKCKFEPLRVPGQSEWFCEYFPQINAAPEPDFTSEGQCVALKLPGDDHVIDEQAAMACAWKYLFFGPEDQVPAPIFVAPVSYSLIAPVPLDK